MENKKVSKLAMGAFAVGMAVLPMMGCGQSAASRQVEFDKLQRENQ